MSDKMEKIVPVILSGGSGTRLWPMSVPERPKQFLTLTGAQTLFEQTLSRVAHPALFSEPIIVANTRHVDLLEEQLADCGVNARAILLEPCARNTAPAIALAAIVAGDAAMLVMPSDHVIADDQAFLEAVRRALPLLDDGWMVTFGIAPTGPETGYGYVQYGDELSAGVHQVRRFVEKPDADRAAALLAEGGHAWNGGIFLFRGSTYLAALEKYAPAIYSSVTSAMEKADQKGCFITPDEAEFAACPSDSVDYAVMEKSDKVAVTPVAMGWSDVGSWDALYEIDASVDEGHILALNTENCLIRTDGIKIHMIGVSDMIVVASGNDILILPRGQSQDVKSVVEALKARRAS